MKRLLCAALLTLSVLLGLAATAFAADLKASGQWITEFLLSDNFDPENGRMNRAPVDGGFNVYQRLRTQFECIASEDLRGVLGTEIATARWGDGFRFHDHNAVINVRLAYVDARVPDTRLAVRAGLQTVDLPSAFGGGSMILSDEVPALTLAAPLTGPASLLAGYARLYDFSSSDNYTPGQENTAFDLGFLALPVTLDSVTFTPFAAYAYAGANAVEGMRAAANDADLTLPGLLTPYASLGQGRNAFWAGAALTVTSLPGFTFMADLDFGRADAPGGPRSDQRSGWLLDLAVDYTDLGWATPELFFAWTSGEDGDASDGSERMPMLSTRNWAVGSFFFGGDTLLQGSTGFYATQLGFWTVGLSLKDMGFVDRLTHTATVLYARGANDERVAAWSASGSGVTTAVSACNSTLTDKDSLWEMDLNNKYKLYDELTLTLDLGYIHASYDKGLWAGQLDGGADAYKLSTGLLYEF